MNAPCWDETTIHTPWNKTIDLAFLRLMAGDFCCPAAYVDDWGRKQWCERNEGHTGRHLATHWAANYPTAVWT